MVLFNVPFANMKGKRVTTYDTTYHVTRELDAYIESETLWKMLFPQGYVTYTNDNHLYHGSTCSHQ